MRDARFVTMSNVITVTNPNDFGLCLHVPSVATTDTHVAEHGVTPVEPESESDSIPPHLWCVSALGR